MFAFGASVVDGAISSIHPGRRTAQAVTQRGGRAAAATERHGVLGHHTRATARKDQRAFSSTLPGGKNYQPPAPRGTNSSNDFFNPGGGWAHTNAHPQAPTILRRPDTATGSLWSARPATGRGGGEWHANAIRERAVGRRDGGVVGRNSEPVLTKFGSIQPKWDPIAQGLAPHLGQLHGPGQQGIVAHPSNIGRSDGSYPNKTWSHQHQMWVRSPGFTTFGINTGLRVAYGAENTVNRAQTANRALEQAKANADAKAAAAAKAGAAIKQPIHDQRTMQTALKIPGGQIKGTIGGV